MKHQEGRDAAAQGLGRQARRLLQQLGRFFLRVGSPPPACLVIYHRGRKDTWMGGVGVVSMGSDGFRRAGGGVQLYTSHAVDARRRRSAQVWPERMGAWRAHTQRIGRSHPVYRRGFRENLEPVQRRLSGIRNLHTIGRHGGFHYDAQSHAIEEGIGVARGILAGAAVEDAG